MLDNYPGKIKLFFKNFPSEGNEQSYKSAVAVLAAHQQNKFWEFHEKLILLTNTPLDDNRIKTLAAELGLDMIKFGMDLQSPAIQSLVNRDITEAMQAWVSGTPAIFINGIRIEDYTLKNLKDMIDAELTRPNMK